MTLPLHSTTYYTLARNIRELQLGELQFISCSYYTLARNIRELQPTRECCRRTSYYTLARNIRELQQARYTIYESEHYTLARNIRELQLLCLSCLFVCHYTLARTIRISCPCTCRSSYFIISYLSVVKSIFLSSHDMIKDAVWASFFDQKAGTRVTWKLSSMYFLVASVWKIFTNFLYAGLSLSFSLAAMIFT